MDALRPSEVLERQSDLLQVIRQNLNLDKNAVKESLDIIAEWAKKQPHFTIKQFDRVFLETLLISKKGSAEKTKHLMDRMLTLRTTMPQLFGDIDVKHDFDNIYENMSFSILPKVTKDYCRIICKKVKGNKFERDYITRLTMLCFWIAGYLRRHDYIAEYYVVGDFTGIDMLELVRKTDLMEFQRFFNTYLAIMGLRIKGILVVCDSNFLTTVVKLILPLIKKKIADRIRFFNSYEELHEVFPKDILPKDFGGEEKSLTDLWKGWSEVLSSEEHKKYMKEINAGRTDETQRPTAQFNEEYMGTPGTFRNLRLD